MITSLRSIALTLSLAGGLFAAASYTATPVATSDGTTSYWATGINSRGDVVGRGPGAGMTGSFLFSNGTSTTLGLTTAVGINDSGQIVGTTMTASITAALYSAGSVTALGPLPGYTNSSWATGINNSGQVVGYGQATASQHLNTAAFLYDGGVMTNLGFLPGGTQSQANGINTSGQIVGWSTNSSGHQEAFLYSAGTMTGLGTLPGYTDSVAMAINDSGQIVGYATDASGNTQAFLYSGGAMTALGGLPGWHESAALAINNKGQIVGYSSASTLPGAAVGVSTAFLYDGGQMVDINSLATTQFAGGSYWEATGINNSGQIIGNEDLVADLLSPAQGRFVPVTPCRVVDTRLSPGAFGGPALVGAATRAFAIPQSACNIPATAVAYSLNVTVLPQGPLAYLSIWPHGANQPTVSTLNATDGRVVANAALVPAGQNGAIDVYVTDPTDLLIDVNGYFDSSSGNLFYPVTPCRVADTRGSAGTLGAPSLGTAETRDFPVPSSACSLPATAAAYSMNVTVVPPGYLGYLTTWPTGQPQPLASTLNSWNGAIVANAALVPAGTGGAISAYAANATDLVLDTNGYFAAPATGGLSFHPVTPCRVADTRNANGPFGGPVFAAGDIRSFAIPGATCGIPTMAAAYALNVTVVPEGALSYLTAWPAGAQQPYVSTLNSPNGTVVANAAIVPAGTSGAVSIYATNPTHVVIDINGYFAP